MLKVKWPQVIVPLYPYSPPILNFIDLGNGTMFRIAAFFVKGSSEYHRDGFQISIDRIGSFFFDFPEIKKYYWSYVAEKLFLPESDARALADWMNAQCNYDMEQQGIYNEQYIREVEEYGLIGEYKIMPLVPEIIEE